MRVTVVFGERFGLRRSGVGDRQGEEALEVAGSGLGRGTQPRLSGDQARQAVEDEVPDRLIGRAAWQMDLDLGFHLDDASGGLDQAQPERVELGDPPGGGLGHQRPQAPQQPVGAGVQEQPELVGGGLETRGTVGDEVSFPGLDVIFRLSAPAIEVLVEGTSAAEAEVGDDEAGIGAVAAGLDAGDGPADPAPAAGGVKELLETADLAAARVASRASTWRFRVLVGLTPKT